MESKWNLLGLPGVGRLPGPQWELYNVRMMVPEKYAAAEAQLRRKLSM